MKFNLKYLILPLSIMVCINNNCINAMEDNIIKEEDQPSMKWTDFEQLVLSFNNDNLDNNKIKFVQRIANAASNISKDKSTWHILSHKKLLFPRSDHDKNDENMIKEIISKTYNVEINKLKRVSFVINKDFEMQKLEKILNYTFALQEELSNFLKKYNCILETDINLELLFKKLTSIEWQNEIKRLYELVENNKNKLTLIELYKLLKEESKIPELTEVFEDKINELQIYESYQELREKKICDTMLLNKDILSYIRPSTFERITEYKNHFKIDDKIEYVNKYENFISAIKQCYEKDRISPEKYKALLNWLLYINVYDAFNTIRNGLLVKCNKFIGSDYIKEESIPILLNYLLEHDTLYNEPGNISSLCTKYEIDSNRYLNQLPIINEIINNLVLLSAKSNMKKEEIKKGIISIIVQGIYDSAYCRKGHESKKLQYEKPSIECNEILKEKSAVDKIDKEFGITNEIDMYFDEQQNSSCFDFFGLFNCRNK